MYLAIQLSLGKNLTKSSNKILTPRCTMWISNREISMSMLYKYYNKLLEPGEQTTKVKNNL